MRGNRLWWGKIVGFGGHGGGHSLSGWRRRILSAPAPECLNRPRQRKAVRLLFRWLH
jgi:hypothetical protein